MIEGVLIVDKPGGLTSHDMVLFLRRGFRIEKVGHAGTLDPMATGVLVMLLGAATKLSNQFISDDKEYDGVLRLGVRTDTHDREGRMLSMRDTSMLTDKDIEDAFSSFCGTIRQIPPMVSALKFKGRRLYKLARRGIEVKREPRRVIIHNIKVKDINMPEVSFFVHCSKGTYIRKLADDIGERLGCGAHLTGLRRIRSGRFTIKDAVPFEELMKLDKKELVSRLSLDT